MQKIKYIIIFVLLLALGMFYTQIVDYQSITNSLLKENQTHSSNKNLLQNDIDKFQNQIKTLQNQVKTLKQEIVTLQNENTPLKEKIIALEEELLDSQMKIHKESYNTPISNQKESLSFDIDSLKKPPEPKTSFYNGPDLTPSVGLSEEREVTGVGLEYKTKF